MAFFTRSEFCLVQLLLLGCLLPLSGQAQAGPDSPQPEVRRFLVVSGGYTGGRFAHSTDDYTPKLSLFGGGKARTGLPVEHRFDGLLLGADYVLERTRPDKRGAASLKLGLNVLAASDRLTIGGSRRSSLQLGAAHPNFEIDGRAGKWSFRGGAGVLVGRVGYFASTKSTDLLSSKTTVDTVHAVPTVQVRSGFNNWILLEGGYGANGLLGLANPVLHSGFGTGFGPRSPVAVLFGGTEGESTDFAQQEPGQYYLRLEVAPAASPWRAHAFITFGSGAYGRVALLAAYRLPVGAAPAGRPQ